MANYNYARFLTGAIASVLNQTYRNLELIVCDDGSRDGSPQLLRSLEASDPRLLVLFKENGGQASAWNHAFARASGEIVAFLDSDDLFHPEKIERAVDRLRSQPGAGLVLNRMDVIDKDGAFVQRLPYFTRFEKGWIAERMLARGGRWRDMPTSALTFRREVLERLFPVPEREFRISADGYLFTLAPLVTEVAAIEDALTTYRVHGANAVGMVGLDVEGLKARHRGAIAQFETCNRRAAELLGVQDIFDTGRNAAICQEHLLIGLLLGTPRAILLRRYLGMAKLLLRDDLYSPAQKTLGLAVYGVAAMLPRRLRPWWLANTIGYSRVKHRIQQGLQALKRLAGR